MLRIIQSNDARQAKSYYSKPDYYIDGQEMPGRWRGAGAEKLGLAGIVEQDAWEALCDNRDPNTDAPLTQRRRQDRRVGWDFNFHAPKSVSLLYAISGDERILLALREAVDETMRDIELETQTRVRAAGKNEDRTTGNFVWGEFVHLTTRPVDGVPDPHVHAHCFVFNATWDETENRWKAAQIAGIKRDAPYFEALFHARLAQGLSELGIPVERSRKGWEVASLSRGTLRKFSRRTAIIEAVAEAEGITNPVEKAELGARTRERKAKNLTFEQLQSEWQKRLDDTEDSDVKRIIAGMGREQVPPDFAAEAREAINWAAEHCFERKAVVGQRELLTEALKRGIGQAHAPSIIADFNRRPWLAGMRDGIQCVTTQSVLDEEQRMLEFARNGRGTRRALVAGEHVFARDWLNEDQRRAVRHILTSRDRVMLIRGAAGTGKTTMMQEAVSAIEATGRKVFTFAPSADASRGVLRAEGFATADTVARLLADPAMQNAVRGEVLWIDEAGLLGSRTMGELFKLADGVNARIILSGDRRQHGSVERGSPLRLLETDAGLVPAEIRDIQRQKDKYKHIVMALSEGRIAQGFRQLDELGWIREVPHDERHKRLAADYVEALNAGKSALVIAPTHREGAQVTAEIRAALKRAGRIGIKERTIPILLPLHLTAAERADPASYLPGDIIEFHQNAKGFNKGQRVVAGADALPLGHPDRFAAYGVGELSLAPGDLVRITKNGTTADGKHRLNNGATYRIDRFTNDGDLVLDNDWRVARTFGHLMHGYVTTSHAAQGKSVKRVFIAQSSLSHGASSREQFYVSVSRGKEQALVYTDDKLALRDAIGVAEDRPTASEFLRSRDRSRTDVTRKRMERTISASSRQQNREGADQMTYER